LRIISSLPPDKILVQLFIGHFGVGFGAKAAVRHQISLGILFLAAQFLDFLWPTLLLLGIERVEIKPGITKSNPLDFVSYPISHSLLMVGIWGSLFAIVYWFVRKNVKAALCAWVLCCQSVVPRRDCS